MGRTKDHSYGYKLKEDMQQIVVHLHLRLTCLPVILPFLFVSSVYLFIHSFFLTFLCPVFISACLLSFLIIFFSSVSCSHYCIICHVGAGSMGRYWEGADSFQLPSRQ
jgi:hypothetical protein